MTSAGADGKSRLKSVDVWRGLAALAVVAMHMRHDAPGGFREHPFFIFWLLSEYGYLGVSFFVIISGFCIHRSSAIAASIDGTYRLNWLGFWRRRFWRLYPAYLAAIVFTLVVHEWILNVPLVSGPGFGWDLFTHLLLFHNLTDEFNTSLGNGVFWSLGMEEQLYGMYFLLFLLFSRGCHRHVLWMVAVVTAGWRLLVPWIADVRLDVGPFHLGSWYHWPIYYWFHWVLGALAVDASAGNKVLPRWCSSWRVAFALLIPGMLANRVALGLISKTSLAPSWLNNYSPTHPGFLTMEYMGELVLAVSFFCMLNAGLKLESLKRFPDLLSNVFAPVGRISYSLYLVHIPVLMMLEAWIPQPPTPSGWIVRWLIYWPAVLAVALIFYQIIERRFIASGRVLNSAD